MAALGRQMFGLDLFFHESIGHIASIDVPQIRVSSQHSLDAITCLAADWRDLRKAFDVGSRKLRCSGCVTF
jgi:hypothetical protein